MAIRDLVIRHPLEPRVLAVRFDAGWTLPRFERDAASALPEPAQIRRWVRATLGIDAIVLRLLAGTFARGEDQVLVLLELLGGPPEGADWVDQDELVLPLESYGPALRAVLAETSMPALRPPWERRGWHEQAVEWIERELQLQGLPVTGEVEQVRTWCLSCVLRVPTGGGMVYFKAAPLPGSAGDYGAAIRYLFANEASVTRELARRFPGSVPAPIAVDTQRGWMLLGDAGAAKPPWADGLRLLGRMQRASVGAVDELLGAGWLDRRLDRLADEVPGLLDEGLELCDLEPAERARLREAGPRLIGMCSELASYGVPPTLVHGDFHPNNVVAAIFDWTDACIAHPFFDLASTLHDPELRPMLEAYFEPWSDIGPPERLRAMAPLVAVLSALHQAVSYRYIMLSLEPGTRWQLMDAMQYFLRGMLDELSGARRAGM